MRKKNEFMERIPYVLAVTLFVNSMSFASYAAEDNIVTGHAPLNADAGEEIILEDEDGIGQSLSEVIIEETDQNADDQTLFEENIEEEITIEDEDGIEQASSEVIIEESNPDAEVVSEVSLLKTSASYFHGEIIYLYNPNVSNNNFIFFKSGLSGTLYYKNTDTATPVDVSEMSATGISVVADVNNSMNLYGYLDGPEKYLQLAVKDSEGHSSDVGVFNVGDGNTYSQDFEVYDVDSTIAQSDHVLREFSYIVSSKNRGTGEANQKVVTVPNDTNSSNKALQLVSSEDSDIAFVGISASKQALNPDSSNNIQILEGKVYIDGETDSNGQVAISLNDTQPDYAGHFYPGIDPRYRVGVNISGGKVYQHIDKTGGAVLGEADYGSWHAFRITMNKNTRRYEIEIDGKKCTKNQYPEKLGSVQYITFCTKGNAKAYFDDLKLTSIPDITSDAPIIEGGSVYRQSAVKAYVKFRSDEPGTYYYTVSDSSVIPSAESIETNTNGSGTVRYIDGLKVDIEGMSTGPKYVYLVVKNDNGYSNVLAYYMPTDFYYFDDYEAYSVGQLHYMEPSFTPINSYSDGKDGYYLTVDDLEGDKAFTLTGAAENTSGKVAFSWDESTVPVANYDDYILEGRFSVENQQPEEGYYSGFYIRLNKNWGNDPDFVRSYGVYFSDGKIFQNPKNTEELGTAEKKTWHTYKIVASRKSQKYKVYIDGEMYSFNSATTGIDQISFEAYGDNTKVYFDDTRLYHEPQKPVLTGNSIWRTGAETANIRFSSDIPGTYYYKVTNSADAPIAESVKDSCDGNGTISEAGAVTTITNPEGLTAGVRYVHAVVDNNGNLSDVKTFALPHDIYYYDDFETYSEGTTIASNTLAPLKQRYEGSGNGDQKVITEDDNHGNVLSIKSASGMWGSEQMIDLRSLGISAGDTCVLEGKVWASEMDSDDAVRFGFASWTELTSTNETGVNIIRGIAYQHYDNRDVVIGNAADGSWHDIKIVVTPLSKQYDVYIDGTSCTDIPFPENVDVIRYIFLSAYWHGKVAKFDDLTFYSINNSIVTVTFDSDGGSLVDSAVVPEGGKVTKPVDPTRDGYTFQGWRLEGSTADYDFDTAVNSNIVLKAAWKINTYTVTFDSNGGTAVAPQSVDHGNKATVPEAPTREGYIFDGWQAEGNAYDFDTPLTQDITLVAGWIFGVHPQVSIEGWTYGEQAKEPLIVEGTNPGGGAVTFEYKEKGAVDSPYSELVPTEAGDYTIRATVAATGSYSAGTGTADFTIAKATREDLALEDTVPNKRGISERKLQLPSLPENESYSNEGIVIDGSVPALISGTPYVADGILTYDTAAQDPGTEATITITVNGGRNYENYKLVVTVSTDGMYAEFKDNPPVFTYTGAKITPEVDVYNNGVLLTPGVDYTVSYSSNVKATRDKQGAVIAGAKVTVKGKGNLSDSKVLTFTIEPKSLGDENGKPADGIETGTINIAAGQKATAPVITYGSYKLGTNDYDITDPMKGQVYTEVGETTLLIEGKGNFTGMVKVPVNVIEDKKNLKKFNVVADTKTAIYFDPFATEDDVKEILASLIKVYDSADKSKAAPLTLDTDYFIAYPSDVTNAGKKPLTIVGTGNYSGSVTKAITIKPLVVKDAKDGQIYGNPEVVSNKEYHFVQGGVTVGEDIVVRYKNSEGKKLDEPLTEGVDYKVAYTNNKAVSVAGKPAEYAITFLGNYKGTPAIKNTKAAKVNVFTILPSAIADANNDPNEEAGFEVCVPDVAYNEKPGTYFSTPVVTLNGSTLAASNYTCRYFYKPAPESEYVEITTKNKLTLSEDKDDIEVQIRIEAKGSLAGKGNYAGTINAEYKVIRQKADEIYDLSKARITIYGKDYDPAKKSNKKLSGIPYNGKKRYVTDIDPDDGKPYGTIVVEYKIGKTYVPLKEGVDYELTYLNNINKGKAIVVINGTNIKNAEDRAFVGSKRTTFSITAFSLKKFLNIFAGQIK